MDYKSTLAGFDFLWRKLRIGQIKPEWEREMFYVLIVIVATIILTCIVRDYWRKRCHAKKCGAYLHDWFGGDFWVVQKYPHIVKITAITTSGKILLKYGMDGFMTLLDSNSFPMEDRPTIWVAAIQRDGKNYFGIGCSKDRFKRWRVAPSGVNDTYMSIIDDIGRVVKLDKLKGEVEKAILELATEFDCKDEVEGVDFADRVIMDCEAVDLQYPSEVLKGLMGLAEAYRVNTHNGGHYTRRKSMRIDDLK